MNPVTNICIKATEYALHLSEMQYLQEKIMGIIKGFGLTHFHYTEIIFSFSAIILAFLIELIFVGWQHSSVKRLFGFDKSLRTDFISCLLSVFNLYNVLAFLFSFGICYYLVGLIQKSLDLKLIWHIRNYFLQCAIIFVVSDFKEYVRHIVFHRVKPLWKLHEFHHSGTDLNIITNYRGHFLETAIVKFFDVIPYIILGAPFYTFFVVYAFVELHHLLVHSSLKSDWGLIGKYLLVSPDAHKIHHSNQDKHFNTNMGATLIVWDRLFGTYYPSEPVHEFGIPDNPYNKESYVKDLFLGISQFTKSSAVELKSLLKSKKTT
jgi:sterol desaturase/sphingolipid hydroxylase (fatty acid hydroxylase superfamily)